jgi:two-component sensor histidine kinase
LLNDTVDPKMDKQDSNGFTKDSKTESDFQADLKLITSVVQYGTDSGDLPLRDPSVDTVLKRLGLFFGSFSRVTELSGSNTRFNIPENGMMLGFDAQSETIRAVKDQIISQSFFGYKLKESHLAGYQLHVFLTDTHNYFSSVLQKLTENFSQNLPVDYAHWRDRVYDFLIDNESKLSPTLKRIDQLSSDKFWMEWEKVIHLFGIHPFLNKTISDLGKQKGEVLSSFQRAQRFFIFQSDRFGESTISLEAALSVAAFITSCTSAQRLIWPWSYDETGGDYRGAIKFLFWRWFFSNIRGGYRIVSETEFNLKYALTRIAIELCREPPLFERDTIFNRISKEFVELYLIDNEHSIVSHITKAEIEDEDEIHNLRSSVALDLWDLAIDRSITGLDFNDEDIISISEIIERVWVAVFLSKDPSVVDLLKICFQNLNDKSPELISKVAGYSLLLPVSVNYRKNLRTKTQIIVPVTLHGKLGGIFIAASMQPALEVRSKLEAGGVDMITRAFTLPYTWHELTEAQQKLHEQELTASREEGWRHWVKNRHIVIDEMIESMRKRKGRATLSEFNQWVEDLGHASRKMDEAFKSYSALISEESTEWVDLEELIGKARNLVEGDRREPLSKGELIIESPVTEYVKVKVKQTRLKAAVEELTTNSYKYATPTKDSPAKISFSLRRDIASKVAYLSVSNSSKGIPGIPTTDNPDEAIITDYNTWLSVITRGRGLDKVWLLIHEQLGDMISAELFRYRMKSDEMMVLGIRFSGDDSCLSFTAGDQDILA